ncbi:MAG TPA: hypothetical protein DD727_03425 [Clostridiales bacterium]|nr:hypothetical protein [Clostridiales bacterium]
MLLSFESMDNPLQAVIIWAQSPFKAGMRLHPNFIRVQYARLPCIYGKLDHISDNIPLQPAIDAAAFPMYDNIIQYAGLGNHIRDYHGTTAGNHIRDYRGKRGTTAGNADEKRASFTRRGAFT